MQLTWFDGKNLLNFDYPPPLWIYVNQIVMIFKGISFCYDWHLQDYPDIGNPIIVNPKYILKRLQLYIKLGGPETSENSPEHSQKGIAHWLEYSMEYIDKKMFCLKPLEIPHSLATNNLLKLAGQYPRLESEWKPLHSPTKFNEAPRQNFQPCPSQWQPCWHLSFLK